MNDPSDFDQRLVAWLDQQAPMHEPEGLADAVLARTGGMRQQSHWARPERWLSMTVITRPVLTPSMRAAWLLLITLLVLALAAGGTIVGARLVAPARPVDGLNGAVGIPEGGAAVIAFDSFLGGSSGRMDGDIYTVRADGTDMRQLTNEPGIQGDATFSPDGTRIAYRDWLAGTVMVMDAGGGQRVLVGSTGPTGPDCAGGLAWSPDGTSIVFPVAATCGTRSDLFIAPSDGSAAATRLLSADVSGSAAAWSPDGTRIAFVGRDESTADQVTTSGTGIYIVDVGPDVLAGDLTPMRITVTGADAPDYWLMPRWSPDGRKVAAVAGARNTCATPASGTMDVYVLDPDGPTQRIVAGEPVDEFSPTWSPDGRQIAFQRQVGPEEWWQGRPCTYRTWIADADGSHPRQVDEPLGADVFPPLWSPDGTRLLGLMPDPDTDDFRLNVLTIDGSSPLVVLPDVGSATWQPFAVPLPPAPSFPATSAAP